jgi:hypothetical protein
MREAVELAFYVAAAILLWGKITSIVMGITLLLYGIYKTNEFMKRINLLRSYTCQ